MIKLIIIAVMSLSPLYPLTHYLPRSSLNGINPQGVDIDWDEIMVKWIYPREDIMAYVGIDQIMNTRVWDAWDRRTAIGKVEEALRLDIENIDTTKNLQDSEEKDPNIHKLSNALSVLGFLKFNPKFSPESYPRLLKFLEPVMVKLFNDLTEDRQHLYLNFYLHHLPADMSIHVEWGLPKPSRWDDHIRTHGIELLEVIAGPNNCYYLQRGPRELLSRLSLYTTLTRYYHADSIHPLLGTTAKYVLIGNIDDMRKKLAYTGRYMDGMAGDRTIRVEIYSKNDWNNCPGIGMIDGKIEVHGIWSGDGKFHCKE